MALLVNFGRIPRRGGGGGCLCHRTTYPRSYTIILKRRCLSVSSRLQALVDKISVGISSEAFNRPVASCVMMRTMPGSHRHSSASNIMLKDLVWISPIFPFSTPQIIWMTAAADIERLRWCHIRSFESSQIIDAENLNLRRTIVGMERNRYI